MPKVLSPAQIDGFWKDGYVAPVRAIATDRAALIREKLEAFEKKTGGPLSGALRGRSHLLFTWLNELIREERIVDAIEDLYGENLFCWASSFFIKEAEDPSFVSWHQELHLLGLVEAGYRYGLGCAVGKQQG